MRRTQIYLDEAQKRALRHLAAERDSSVSDLVREAVSRMLTDEGVDWGARFDAFRQRIETQPGPGVTDEDVEQAVTEVRATRTRRTLASSN